MVRAPRSSAPRRDWKTLDQATVVRLHAAAVAIRARTPPERVTYEALERETVGRGWLRKRAAKMPRSQTVASTLIESLAGFRRRRAEAVADAMPGAEAWKVLRTAGLPGSELAMVRDIMRAGSRPHS